MCSLVYTSFLCVLIAVDGMEYIWKPRWESNLKTVFLLYWIEMRAYVMCGMVTMTVHSIFHPGCIQSS